MKPMMYLQFDVLTVFSLLNLALLNSLALFNEASNITFFMSPYQNDFSQCWGINEEAVTSSISIN